jgi:peptidoglycan/xylan/chitin deacetylase (PgdA/CDA1 family)
MKVSLLHEKNIISYLMWFNYISNMLNLLPGKISRTALKIVSFIDFNMYRTRRITIPNPSTSSTCKCVIFRLDDVPYDLPIYNERIIEIHLAIISLFLKRNQSISLGLVMRYIELHPVLVNKIIEGFNKGLLELVLHGWDHVYYSKLSKEEQANSLSKANTRMLKLFGTYSKIFIPPYNEFNRSTLDVLTKLGIKIISASVYSDYHRYFIVNQIRDHSIDSQIFHLPEMASFEKFQGIKPIRIPIEKIISNIENNVSKYGYAVITLHPQSFVKFTEGRSTESSLKESNLDTKQINQLDDLIKTIMDRNMQIKSFSEITGIE